MKFELNFWNEIIENNYHTNLDQMMTMIFGFVCGMPTLMNVHWILVEPKFGSCFQMTYLLGDKVKMLDLCDDGKL